jgi:hypothetical protein
VKVTPKVKVRIECSLPQCYKYGMLWLAYFSAVFAETARVERFGGAYRVEAIPLGLII